MDKRKYKHPVAVIEIGSNNIKMRVAQADKLTGGIKDLDILEAPIALGHEVFSTGKVTFDTLKEISTRLKGFSKIMSEYGITNYRVAATSALRSAVNRSYVVDQLRIQTGMKVDILEDSQEKALIYDAVLRLLNKTAEYSVENALLSYIGTGSIGIAHCIHGKIEYSQNINLGSLRLGDMLRELENETDDPFPSVEEYMENTLGLVAEEFTQGIGSLFVTGTDTESIALLCRGQDNNGIYQIRKKDLHSLYESIRTLSTEAIALQYNLSYDEAEILYASVAIYCKLAEFTKAEIITAPRIKLSDALLHQMLTPADAKAYAAHIRTNALACADRIAQHYHSDIKHCQTAATLSCIIFDRMKKIHGLTSHERLLLELAAKLHDCGYYVNSRNHHLSSYYLIKNSAIYGLTEEEISLIAQITQYSETHVPTTGTPGFFTMSEQQRLMVSKLAAILRMANAMDKSHKSKVNEIKVKLTDDKITITAISDQSLYLEKWAFKECAPFFQEVFGITPELLIKTLLLK